MYAADKVSKVRELRILIATGLGRDAAALKLRHYRKSLHMLEKADPASRLVDLLRFEIEAIETLPPEQPAPRPLLTPAQPRGCFCATTGR